MDSRAEKLTLDISHLNAVRAVPATASSSSPSPSSCLYKQMRAECTVCVRVAVVCFAFSLFLDVVAQLCVCV